MSMMNGDYLKLVVDQNSSDNNARTQAEIDFNHVTREDPTQCALVLIESTLNGQLPLDVRQSCLLHLKRLVPKFWSLGFESFVGPPINQELKQTIRTKLIHLATSSPESKIRSGSAYVITQIAAADYPDEWPNLLQDLYQSTTKYDDKWAMIGGLSVLNELFDDLITEEQFWDGGVGNQLINHITQILSQKGLGADIKSSTLKFYKSVFNTLQSPEAFGSPHRLKAVHDHISSSIPLFFTLLGDSIESTQNPSADTDFHQEIRLRSYINEVVASYYDNFSKSFDHHNNELLLYLLLKDLTFLSSVYHELYYNNNIPNNLAALLEENTLPRALESLFPTLGKIQHSIKLTNILPEDTLNQFIENLIKCATLPVSLIEEYEADFNTYATNATGLAVDGVGVREAINEFLSELNDQDAGVIFGKSLQQFYQGEQVLNHWRLREANLYLLESLFMNEDSKSIGQDIQLADLCSKLTAINDHPLVIGRSYLSLPRFFEKFESKLSVNEFGVRSFEQMIKFSSAANASGGDDDWKNLVKISALISCTLYNNLIDLSKKIPTENQSTLQVMIFNLVLSLIEDAEEDSLPVLLESITMAINVNPQFASKLMLQGEVDLVDLIFKISFKEPSNVQLTVDSDDCLSTFLSDIDSDSYIRVCEKSLPFIFTTIDKCLSKTVSDFVPELELSLNLLSVIIGSSPQGSQNGLPPFPNEVFLYTFPILKNLILIATDDQILQSSGEVFNNLLQKAPEAFINYVDPESKQSGVDLLLMITSKFLSPDLSDRAALNCGSIVLTILEKFDQHIGEQFQQQLLEATVRRLVIAKEVITIENLILVFCKLVLNSSSPDGLISFLYDSVSISTANGSQNGLQIVLPIWFNAFEITRGYELIKTNTLALGKLFTSSDQRIESMVVNGDIIPYQGNKIITRSMSQSMPDEYTKIPAPLKILKLFVSELNFQCQQPDAEDFLPGGDGADDADDEGWEDMDDIGVPNYEKLKSYVEDDTSDEDPMNADEDLKNILVQFFKECLGKNLGNFQKFYEMLDDDEKKIITENVVF